MDHFKGVRPKPSATLVSQDRCVDAQGSFTCGAAYDLDCN